jgi:hypothetical protein
MLRYVELSDMLTLFICINWVKRDEKIKRKKYEPPHPLNVLPTANKLTNCRWVELETEPRRAMRREIGS